MYRRRIGGENMLRVLLVDDEPFIVQGLSMLIDWKKHGFEIVATASNGQEGLDYLKTKEVDLIIADIRMPVMSGIDMLKTIREEHISEAYFIILSGYSDFCYAQKAIQYSCLDYVLKPIQKQELISILQRIVQLYETSKVEKEERLRIEETNHSFQTATIAKSLQGFCVNDAITYYKERERTAASVLCKKQLDDIIYSIECNDEEQIQKRVELLYNELNRMEMVPDLIYLNINYLLFQLIHLASAQDSSVNQEEIMHYISDSAFDGRTMCGSQAHLTKFSIEYAKYLVQLRKNVSGGILADIERELRERYTENITLKELSKQYYVNSVYLGKIYRKKYGMAFKDYLNQYRIEQATVLLSRTEKRVYEIAADVGYHNLDYFISKFIATKGCTPTKFRRQLSNEAVIKPNE